MASDTTRTSPSSPKTPFTKISLFGLPGSGKETQGAKLSSEFNLPHLSLRSLIMQYGKDTSSPIGKEVRDCQAQHKRISSELLAKIVSDKIEKDDACKAGWVLSGIPRDNEDAEALEAMDVEPQTFVVLQFDDDHSLERAQNRRYDPETGKTYDVKERPPPADIADRCVVREEDKEENIHTAIANYYQDIDQLRLNDKYRKIGTKVDASKDEQEVFLELCKVVRRVKRASSIRRMETMKMERDMDRMSVIDEASTKTPVEAPTVSSPKIKRASTKAILTPDGPPRIAVFGAPCSGKDVQAKMLADAFGLVLISTRQLIHGAGKGGPHAMHIQECIEKGQEPNDDVFIDLVGGAIVDNPECDAKGWVLSGSPSNGNIAEELEKKGVVPQCFIVLNDSEEQLMERMSRRRFHPDGSRYDTLTDPPPPEKESECVSRAEDSEDNARAKIANYFNDLSTLRLVPLYRKIGQKVECAGLSKEEVHAKVIGTSRIEERIELWKASQ